MLGLLFERRHKSSGTFFEIMRGIVDLKCARSRDPGVSCYSVLQPFFEAEPPSLTTYSWQQLKWPLKATSTML